MLSADEGQTEWQELIFAEQVSLAILDDKLRLGLEMIKRRLLENRVDDPEYDPEVPVISLFY